MKTLLEKYNENSREIISSFFELCQYEIEGVLCIRGLMECLAYSFRYEEGHFVKDLKEFVEKGLLGGETVSEEVSTMFFNFLITDLEREYIKTSSEE